MYRYSIADMPNSMPVSNGPVITRLPQQQHIVKCALNVYLWYEGITVCGMAAS